VLVAIFEISPERAFLATALHTPVRGQVEVLRDALIVAGGDARIQAIHPANSPGITREAPPPSPPARK
jgi:hypothetical protein